MINKFFTDKKARASLLIIFLIISIFAVVIVAAENSTDSSAPEQISDVETNLDNGGNIPPTDSCMDSSCEDATEDMPSNSDLPAENLSIESEGIVDETINETSSLEENLLEENESIPPDEPVIPEENVEEDVTPEISVPLPEFDVEFSYLNKVTRGGDLEIDAVISNIEIPAKNVIVTWILPDDLELSSGDLIRECGNMQPPDKCELSIKIRIPDSMPLGINKIKLNVDYGK